VVVVGAGYPGKRPIYERMVELDARLVIVEEVGHWSAQLVADGVASDWLAVTVSGNADADATAVLDALSGAAHDPDAVLTFWELSVPVVARTAGPLARRAVCRRGGDRLPCGGQAGVRRVGDRHPPGRLL